MTFSIKTKSFLLLAFLRLIAVAHSQELRGSHLNDPESEQLELGAKNHGQRLLRTPIFTCPRCLDGSVCDRRTGQCVPDQPDKFDELSPSVSQNEPESEAGKTAGYERIWWANFGWRRRKLSDPESEQLEVGAEQDVHRILGPPVPECDKRSDCPTFHICKEGRCVWWF